MARYRKVDVRMWLGGSFSRLSPLKPSGQALWLYLITNPDTTSIPGLFRAGQAQMAEALGWPMKAFREAFAEVLAEGMVEADWEARVVWVPNAVEFDPPGSLNVVKSWATWWVEIPQCALKVKAHQRLKAYAEGMSDAFGDAFRLAVAKPCAIQEQEQEQEQEEDFRHSDSIPDPKPEALIAIWNEHRGPLPEVVKITPERRKQAKGALADEPDLAVWTKAIQLKAKDPFWNEKGFGFQTMTRPSKRSDYLDAARQTERIRSFEEIAGLPEGCGFGGEL